MRLLLWLAGMKLSLNPKELLRRFTEIDDTPHAIALGSAIGMFWGFTPLYGLKILLTLVTARMVRGHMVAAAIAVTVQDVFLPVMPFILIFQLEMGNHLLGRRTAGGAMDLRAFKLEDLLQWTTYLREAFPFLLGALIIGALAGAVTYAGVYYWAGGRRRSGNGAAGAGE
jgi:uncharacterized protein (DUF2062 family)